MFMPANCKSIIKYHETYEKLQNIPFYFNTHTHTYTYIYIYILNILNEYYHINNRILSCFQLFDILQKTICNGNSKLKQCFFKLISFIYLS